jgi:hypothetical protein
VSVTGTVLEADDDIACVFGDEEVKGVYVREDQALCVSPELSQTGRVLFQLTTDIGFNAQASYIICKPLNPLVYNSYAVFIILQCRFSELLKYSWKVKSLSSELGIL